jgi:hypothetical protein
MFSNGWVRLWILFTTVLLTVTFIVFAYDVWGMDVCYGFVSVSIVDNPQAQYLQLAENIKGEATTKTFCGKSTNSILLTLESLAQHNVVTQIGLQWLEPNGWSFDHDTLDVLNDNEITAKNIIDLASTHTYKARLLSIWRTFVVIIFADLFLLAFGFGIAWVKKGFTKRTP